MKQIALLIAFSMLFSIAAFAQDPEPTPAPEPLWTETVTLQPGETFDLVAFLVARTGNTAFCNADNAVVLNGDNATTYVAVNVGSKALLKAIRLTILTIRGVQ
jgi:hypothetical protein